MLERSRGPGSLMEELGTLEAVLITHNWQGRGAVPCGQTRRQVSGSRQTQSPSGRSHLGRESYGGHPRHTDTHCHSHLDPKKALPPLSFTGGRLCHRHRAEAWESLPQLCPHQQHTVTQNFPPSLRPGKSHLPGPEIRHTILFYLFGACLTQDLSM